MKFGSLEHLITDWLKRRELEEGEGMQTAFSSSRIKLRGVEYKTRMYSAVILHSAEYSTKYSSVLQYSAVLLSKKNKVKCT